MLESLFNKVAFRPATLLKRDSNRSDFKITYFQDPHVCECLINARIVSLFPKRSKPAEFIINVLA